MNTTGHQQGRKAAAAALLALGAIVAVPVSAADSADDSPVLRSYLSRDMVFVTSPGIETYLLSLAEALLRSRPDRPPVPRFLVQSTEDFSVFTDTQGNIVVGSAVLRQVESEDELAAALSHELSHVIARDASAKSVVLRVPYTVETLGVIASALDARNSKSTIRPGQTTEFGGDSVAATQSVGTFWTDLLAPSWNRQQERAADLSGVDLLRAAGYDPAAFSSLFTRVDAAHSVRSDRVEKVRQAAVEKARGRAAAVRPASGSDGDIRTSALQSLKQMQGDAEVSAIDALFNSISGLSTDYDTPEQRTAAVLGHVQQTSTGRKDKVRRSPRFAAELREGSGGQLLQMDQAALRLLAAINAGNPRTAESDAVTLLASASAPASPHLNFATGAWLETQGRADEAEQRSLAWMNSDLAPRAAYTWRASFQERRQQYPEALATLERGAAQLDDRSLFLPRMVALAKASGDVPKAEKLTAECAGKGIGFDLGTISRALEDDVPREATGLYGECVAALGYDPIENSRQKAPGGNDASRLSKKTDEFGKKLSETLRKLGR